MKKLLILALSILICLNQTILVFAEKNEIRVNNEENSGEILQESNDINNNETLEEDNIDELVNNDELIDNNTEIIDENENHEEEIDISKDNEFSILPKEEMPINKANPENDLTVSQDEETGEIIITSDHSAIFDDLITGDNWVTIKEYNSSNSYSFQYNTDDCLNNLYFDISSNDQGKQFISISKEVLLADNIPSGKLEFQIRTNNGNTLFSAIVDNVDACKEFANIDELNIFEDTVNRQIIIQVNDADDLDFLRSLCKESEYEWLNNKRKKAYEGGSVYFANSSGIYNQKNRYNHLVLDEDNLCITISENVLKNKGTLNDSNILVRFYAYGYSQVEKEIEQITIGCSNIDDIELNISQNSDGDVIIEPKPEYSDYEGALKFLQAVAESQTEDDNGNINYEGGRCWIGNSDIGYEFSNRDLNDYQWEEISYSDGKLKIPYDVIKKERIPKNTIFNRIQFHAPGYKQVTKQYSFTLTKGCESVPDYDIYEDSDGNIIISVDSNDDLEWLENICLFRGRDYDYYKYDNDLSNVRISKNDGYCFIRNSFYNSYEKENIKYDEDNLRVVIENNVLINYDVCNGMHSYEIESFGYVNTSGTIELHNACKSAPTGVTIEQDSDGNIVIRSEDTEWLEKLATVDDDGRTGDIKFFKDNDNSYYFRPWRDDYNNHYVLSDDKKKLTINKELLLISNIPDGIYTVGLFVYGYEDLELPNVEIVGGAKHVNSQVTIAINDSGLTINCDNKDYLKALSTPYEYHWSDNDPNGYSKMGSYIDIRHYFNSNSCSFTCELSNQKNYYNNKLQENYQIYSYSNGRILIPKKVLLDNKLLMGNNCIELYAYGYEEIIIDNVYSYYGVTDCPNDIEIAYDEDIDAIKISSSDSKWLNGIVTKRKNNNSGNYSHVCFNNGSENNYRNYWFYNDDYETHIYMGNGYAYIPKNVLLGSWNKIPTGEYFVEIASDGYANYESDEKINVVGYDNAPVDIDIYQEGDKVYIKSENKEYLISLTKPYVYRNDVLLEYGSAIYDDCSYRLSNGIVYDNVKQEAYFSLNSIKDYWLTKHSNNEINVYLDAYGYSESEKIYIFSSIKTETDLYKIVEGSEVDLNYIEATNVEWSSSNDSVITIDNNGKISALKPGSSIITAIGTRNGRTITDSVEVKVVSSAKVSGKLSADRTIVNVGDTVELKYDLNYELGENNDVEYELSNNEVAEIVESDNEYVKVKFNKACKDLKVSATAFDKKSTIKFQVYSIDKSKKINSVFSNQDNYFEVGDLGSSGHYKVLTYANQNDIIDSSLLDYQSSNINVVSVDSDGKLSANGTGNATITVLIKDDPSSRKATVKIAVVDKVANEFVQGGINVLSNDAITSNSIANGVRNVYINYDALDSGNKIKISNIDSTKDKYGNEFTPFKMSYLSTDTSIATVDSNGYVTFKKNGQVTITCTVSSNPKDNQISQDIIFRALDYSPKIESNKIIINKFSLLENSINIYKAIGTEIEDVNDVELLNANTNEKDYFNCCLDENDGNKAIISLINIGVPAKTYSEILRFKVKIGNIYHLYSYKVSVIVTSALPSVTTKLTGNYNTFTNDNTLKLDVSAKNATIRDIKFIDNNGDENDWASFKTTLANQDINCTKDNGKVVTSGKIRVYFEGYNDNGYVDKPIKLPTVSTKPTVKLDNSSVSLFVPEGTSGNKTVSVKLVDKNKQPITSGKVELITDGSLACTIGNTNQKITDGTVTFNISELKSGKINFYYYEANDLGINIWNDKIKLSLSVNVTDKYPTAKLSSSSITLNTHFHTEDSVGISLSSLSETIKDDDGVDCQNLPDGMSLSYDDGYITIASTSVAPGTYKLVLTPYLNDGSPDGYPLKNVNLTVKVNSDVPELKLKSNTITLNNNYSETILVDYTLNKNTYNTSLIGIDNINPIGSNIANIVYENNKLKFSLKEENKAQTSGSYKYEITPIFTGNVIGKPITVTIKINNKLASAKASIASAFNPLENDASSLLKVTLSNITGNVTDIAFVTNDLANQLFDIEDNEKIVSSASHDLWKTVKDQTLKTKVKIKTDVTGDTWIESDLSIKIARKAPTVKLTTPTINVYNTTLLNSEVGSTEYEITTVDANVIKDNISISLSAAYDVYFDDIQDKFIVKLKDGAKLKSGSTQTFSIIINWNNDFYNGKQYSKQTTIKLNVKDLSYFIKTANK